MPEPSPEAVEALFLLSADLAPELRGTFLDEECAGDPGLRAAVEELLHFDAKVQNAPDFLHSRAAPLHTALPLPAEPGLPSYIGGYRILRRHGEGGMGTVYEAEQDNPRRTVALKVIRPDLVSAEFLIRFKQEAQILGRLQHSGIAQVYEAGRGHDGQPFFAMEFVRGTSLDEYARGRALSAPARLELLARVCDAVQHAHDKGVVHRDLKPSNILIDESGQPKVLDFGVARITDADRPTTSSQTQTGQLLGTVHYMSPEQLTARPSGLDARSDVYTLGVVLFELLARRLPYHLDQLPVHEAARVIEQQEPSRLGSIDKFYRGDVEIIVAKALEKDRTRRYASAGDLASDIRRYLRGESILARKVSPAERYWQWARRNPFVAALGGILTGVLVLATVGSLLAARLFHTQAETQRKLASAREAERWAADRARAQEAAARRNSDEANARLRANQEALLRTVYATRSNLALAAWETAEVGRLRALLDLMRPAAGDPDLRGWEWRYLWLLSHEDRLMLRADQDDFGDVAFSPDGQRLAGLERIGRIRLWDRHTGESRWTTGVTTEGRRTDMGSGVSAIAFSPDGRSLAGPGPDASLVLYAVDSGRPILRFEGSPGAALNLAWSPDGRTLVAALSTHTMRVWDACDGRLIHKSFGKHDGPIFSIAFSPDGRTLASASSDRTVKLWNPEDQHQPRAVLKGHTDEVRAVAFSPDGRRIASAGHDRTLRIWDARSGAELAVLWGHTGSVFSLAYFPDSARVATGSADETVRVWDTASSHQLRIFKSHSDRVIAVAVSPDGRDLASASSDRTVRVWDAASPSRPRALHSPSVLTYGGGVECLAFSPDGRRLVSGHDDTALRVWEFPSGRPLLLIRGHSQPVKCVVFSPDGRTFASGGPDRTVRLWDAETGQCRLTYTGHNDQLRGLVFTLDGRTVLSAGYDRTIQAWDPATGVVRYALTGHSDTIHDLALSPDGRTLASASYDKTCILWDLATRQPRATLRGHTDHIFAVVFSADGRTLATAGKDRTVRLWDAGDGAPRGILEGHIDDVDGLAFSPDGRIASSAQDKTIRLWDPASGQTLLILKGHTARIRCIRFSPDGRTLASASSDHTVKLWEAAPTAVLAAP